MQSVLRSKVSWKSENESQREKIENPRINLSFIHILTITGKKYGAKRAQLSAWITLHSIPEETIITPNILEFLEQALEPIPTFNVRDTSAEAAAAGHPAADTADMFEDSSSGSHAGQAVTSANLTSFPVEVIVYFHMQSSTFRFSCIPMSRVECMLRLPSLDMVCMN